MSSAPVSITIVTYNSQRFLRRCLDYALAQDYPRFEVIVVDNASTDGTRDILQEFSDRVRIALNDVNVGFAAGQNQAIAMSDAHWILTLNPDVRLQPNFLALIVAAGESDRQIGSVCGKLLTMGPDFEIPQSAKGADTRRESGGEPVDALRGAPDPATLLRGSLRNPLFDSTGIFMTPNLRHFDRGSRVPDTGQYDRPEFVFGGTGAACLYRRLLIEDVSSNGEFFDEDFFAYREDADVAWRAQLLGWKCLYTPQAVGYHVRSVVPSNRNAVSSFINMHSVKNRWLLRIKNMTGALYRRFWLAVTFRDLVVIGGCLLRERSSLQAFPLVWKLLPRTLAKRRDLMRRRRVSDAYIAAWFAADPVSFPAPAISPFHVIREQIARG